MPLGIFVEAVCVPLVKRDAVTWLKSPVTFADDIGLDEKPVSPVTVIVEPPEFSQVPLANCVREEGIFHPFEAPKYLVAPTDISLISGV